MSQSRRMSVFETCVSTAIGMLTAYALQLAVFPLVGIEIQHSQHWLLVLVFTFASVVRSYCVRRLFNMWK